MVLEKLVVGAWPGYMWTRSWRSEEELQAEVPPEKQSMSLNTIQVYGEVNGYGTTSGAWGSSERSIRDTSNQLLFFLFFFKMDQQSPLSDLIWLIYSHQDSMVRKLQGWIKKTYFKIHIAKEFTLTYEYFHSNAKC